MVESEAVRQLRIVLHMCFKMAFAGGAAFGGVLSAQEEARGPTESPRVPFNNV